MVAKLTFVLTMLLVAFFMWANMKPSTTNSAYTKDAQEPNQEEPQPTKQQDEAIQQVHMTRSTGERLEMDLEEYLKGVVGSEMPASFELEALKAQAVAARTFAAKRSFQVDDTTASQVYHDEEQMKQIWGDNYDKYHAIIEDAVNQTKGEVMTYQGELITAAFFSSCNGFTNNSEDYWKDAQAYLRSVESPWDKEEDGNEQSVSFTTTSLGDALGFQKPVQAISAPIRYDNGYVKSVTIDGIVFTGRELRETLKLRSSAFDIAVRNEEITITTHGYGHGIGMSQYGAQGMAKEGKDYQSILKHYYQGVEITKLHV